MTTATDLSPSITLTLPIRTVSEANKSGHWRAHSERIASQRGAAFAALVTQPCLRGIHLAFVKRGNGKPRLMGDGLTHMGWHGATVSLVRIAPRLIKDVHENLPMCFKHVVDGIADALNTGEDGDGRIEWRYAQRKGAPKQYAVHLTITPRPA